MKDKNENLLDAVLLDEPAHEASLRVVRRAARRRRWSRHLRHGALVAVAFAAGITLLQQRRTVEKRGLPAREASYVVHSRALSEDFMVRTRENSVLIVTTIRTSVEFFNTASTPAPERIDDEMLLQLAPGAALVRYQAGPAELLFPSNANAGLESRAGHE